MLPVLPVFVKLIAVLAHCGALVLKLARGDGLIFIVFAADVAQPVTLLVVMSVTVLMPPDEYTTPDGFCEVDVAGEAPEPKSQRNVTPAVDPVLVKSTASPEHTGAVEVKPAVGVWLIVTV